MNKNVSCVNTELVPADMLRLQGSDDTVTDSCGPAPIGSTSCHKTEILYRCLQTVTVTGSGGLSTTDPTS